MRLIYAIPIILLPNTAHLPANVSVTASVALIVIAMLLGDRDLSSPARRGYMFAPLVALFLAMLVGFVAAQWHDVSRLGEDLREGKVALLYPFLYLAYLHCGMDLKRTRQLIALVVIVAVGAGLEAVIQGASFDLGTFSETQRATGPFGQIKMANRAGIFFAMFLPFLVALALQPHQKAFVRLVAIAGSVILVAAILFTFSRQSYLIALFGIMVLLIWRSIPVALLAAAVLAFAAITFVPKSVVDRVQQTEQGADGAGGVMLDPSTASRLEIWNGTLQMLRDHPNGVGLGRFNDHIGSYTNYIGKDAHNGFLLTLAECGPLGLLALLWVFWRLWRLAGWLRRSGSSKAEDRALERGFTLAVVSMALGNMYGSPFFDSLIMANFWILCGLMERYGNIREHAAQAIVENAERSLPLGLRFPLAARALPGLTRIRNARH